MIGRDDCLAWDESDPIAPWRDRFEIPAGVIYLDGNSLGPRPIGVRQQIERVLDEWATDLIAGWWDRDWVNLPLRVGARLEPLLGAEPGTVVCADSTSINLYKAVGAACSLLEGDIVTDRGNFPTDLYILRTVAQRWGRRLVEVEPEGLEASIGPDVGVLAATHVDYRTGRRHDLAAITAAAQRRGIIVVWDLSHSAGAMPIDLAANSVDLAVGCGYKYLNGGPGAPAYIYVAPRWQQLVSNPINGWFAHAHPFDFAADFLPAAGIDRMRVGTPDVLSMTAMETALEVWEGVDLGLLRAKSVKLTQLFIDLIDEQVGTEVITPRHPTERGGQVSLRLPGAEALIGEAARRGVVGDYRKPDVARFGLAPLYTRYVDVWDAVSLLAKLV
jgi:kynureninase